MSYLWPLAGVVMASAGVWAAMVAFELALAWFRRRSASRVSGDSLRAYARDEMREAAPQYVCWPSPAERAERGKL